MKPIAIVGYEGMVGSMVFRYLRKNPLLLVHGFGRDNIHSLLKNQYHYEYIVNCAGAIKQKVINSGPLETINIIESNSVLPARLALLQNFKYLLHLSSDAVFSDNPNDICYEDSAICPEDLYGKTKALGEINKENVYNFRCSIIGEEQGSKYSLLSWFLAQKDEVSGFTNVNFNGITSLQLAKIYENIIVNDLIPDHHIQHLIPCGYVTKNNLLNLIKKSYKKSIIIRPKYSDKPVNRILGTKYSEYLKEIWGGPVKTIDKMIEEMADYSNE